MKLHYDPIRCTGCGVCTQVCPQQILKLNAQHKIDIIDETRCMGCFGCEDECVTRAFRVSRSHGADIAPMPEPAPSLEEEVDLIVVGAGPAGLGAAIGAARRGLSVCVFERLPNREISHHVDGGVLVSFPGLSSASKKGDEICFDAFDFCLPASLDAKPCDRFGLMGPGTLKTGDTIPPGHDPPWMVNKDRFVKTLADEAERQGVTLAYDHKVVELLREGRGEETKVFGIRLEGGREIRAKVTIAADGVQGKISKQAGLKRSGAGAFYATVLAYEFPGDASISRGLHYMEGDLRLEDGMPPAMIGVGVGDRIHVFLVLLFPKKVYRAPKPMDHYLELVLARDPRMRELLGETFDASTPLMLNGCRVPIRKTNHDIVRAGFVSIGDAFSAGGELGNVPSLEHGMRTAEVVAKGISAGDVSREALASAADFIDKRVVQATEMNGEMKRMPMVVSEEELSELFEIMQGINYPTMLFGGVAQQGWMFTKLFARHVFTFMRKPKLLGLMMGKVPQEAKEKGH